MATTLDDFVGDLRSPVTTAGAERALPAVVDRLKTLRCLVAVARHGSAARAAEAVHLSQPAVTRAVLDLEAFCGLPLFERVSRGMVVTAAGKKAAQRAELLFDHLAKGAAEAVSLSPDDKGRPGTSERFANSVTAGSLKALTAMGQSPSEAQAAELLGLSQPAVHRALRLLEEAIGTQLLQKTSRGSRLTHSGEALLRRTKLAFAEARAMEGDMAAWHGKVRGRVIVGVLPLSVAMILPRAVDAVLRRHPDVEITIIDGTYESLTRQLLSAEVDLIVGALRREPTSDEVRQEVLFADELAVVAQARHPCFDGPLDSLADLLKWEWVVPLRNTPAAAAIDRVFRDAGLSPPKDQLRASSPAMTHALVMQANRLALTSLAQVRCEETADQLRVVPVALSETSRSIGLATRSFGDPSPDLRVLAVELRRAAVRFKGGSKALGEHAPTPAGQPHSPDDA